MKPDVIILGGGPNGLAAALALGGLTLPRPLRVLLLDSRDPTVLPQDSRGTALTSATQLMLQTLGVWNELQMQTAPMRDVIVTDSAALTENWMPALTLQSATTEDAPAAMVENGHLAAALLHAAQQAPSIQLQGGFDFSHFELTAGKIALHAKDGTSQSAPLLVAADGRNSSVRGQLGIAVSTHDYGQTALSFAITHTLPHNHIAEEHFTPDGVFAVLPLVGERCSIVWGTAPSEAEHLMGLDEDSFNTALQQRMGSRLGAVKLAGRKAAYPLSRLIAHECIGPRVALLGDAAHAIHPLAGLGLNLGFKDAAALADCLAQAHARGEDLGSPSVLERYQAMRRFETLATSWAMDGLNMLFVNGNPLLHALRGVGMKALDKVPQAKSVILAEASGLSQNNPRLMQGLLPG